MSTINPTPSGAVDSCSLTLSGSDFSNFQNSLVVIGNNALVGQNNQIGLGTNQLSAELTLQGALPTGSNTQAQIDVLNIQDQNQNRLLDLKGSGDLILGSTLAGKSPTIQSIQLNSLNTTLSGNLTVKGNFTSKGSFSLLSDSPPQFTFQSPLNVQTGSDSNTAQLWLRGPDALSTSAALQVSDNSGNNLLTVTDDGRVGIGAVAANGTVGRAGRTLAVAADPNASAADPNASAAARNMISQANTIPTSWPATALEVTGSIQVSSGFINLPPANLSTAGSFCRSDLSSSENFYAIKPHVALSGKPLLCGPAIDGAVISVSEGGNHVGRSGLCACKGAIDAGGDKNTWTWVSVSDGTTPCFNGSNPADPTIIYSGSQSPSYRDDPAPGADQSIVCGCTNSIGSHGC